MLVYDQFLSKTFVLIMILLVLMVLLEGTSISLQYSYFNRIDV